MADFLITFFLGLFGIHRFMKKKYVTGFIWLFTAGLFGIGWIVDVCIAFGNMVKGGEKEGDKSGQAGLVNPTGAGQAGLMVQPQAGQKGRQAAGQKIQAGQPQSSGQTKDGEKKGFWASWKEKAIKDRQERAVRDAYKKEEEKRKPKINKIKHTRALTPQEQQSIDTLNMEITKLYNDYKIKRLTYNDYLWGSLRFESRIKEIRRRAEWYETIGLPPEVDPDTPIYVDEEAIRNRITGLF